MGKNVKIILIILVVACFAVVGVCSCGKQNPKNTDSEMPDRGPYIQVTIEDPNASPGDVEVELAEKLEKVLMALAASKTVTTSCQTGRCTAKVYFKSEKSIGASLDLVRQKMQELRASLPADVGECEVSVVQPQTPIVTVDVYGDLPMQDLIGVAEKLRTQILVDLPDSVTAEITGQKETHIQLEPSRMAAYAITAGKILESIRSARDSITPDTLPLLVVDRPVLLGDIATVSEGYSGPIIRTDGKACVEIKLYAPSQDQTRAIAERVRESVDRQRTDLPENVQDRIYSHAEGTGTGPVRLRVTVDLPRLLSTNNDKQEIHRLVASPLALELEKLEGVESVRSAVTERDVMIELTFGPSVPFQQAMELIRDKTIAVEIPHLVSMLGPKGTVMEMRPFPQVIERCPPTRLARVDISGSDDVDTLGEAATQVSKRLREIQGVGSIEMQGLLGLRRRVLRPRLDMAKLANLGVSPQEVMQEVRLCTEEGDVVQVDGGASVIRVSYRDDSTNAPRDPLSQSIMTKDGHMIPLSALVDVDCIWEIPEITRVDGIRVGSMNVYSDGTCDTAELTKRIRDILDDGMDTAGNGIKAKLLVR